MDSQRNIFVIALLFVSLIIWQIWQTEHAINHIDQNKEHIANNTKNVNKLDTSTIKQSRIITVKTDVLLLKINTKGGDIDQAFLTSYRDKINSPQPFHLLYTSPEFVYQAQSGLIGENRLDDITKGIRPIFNTNQDTYILVDNKKELCVPFIYTSPEGVIYKKKFIFKRGDFSFNINYDITNNSNKPIKLSLLGQLKQSINLPKSSDISSSNFTLHTYRGAAYSTSEKKYKKYSFKDIRYENLNVITDSGWIAMLQQYFVTAWIPLTPGKKTFFTTRSENDIATIGFKSDDIDISVGSKMNIQSILWIGPKIQDKMAEIANNLDLTIDYGWLWFISQPMFKLLKLIYCYIGNWGLSIIIITFIVRGITYPLTKAQYVSMAKIKILQPKLKEIREKLDNDKEKQRQKILALYKEEKVNPLGGCLPLIIQMPIFLALYYMLSGSIELRHAPFALWINDLSAQDPYYILPIFMGITMFFIQKMSNNTVIDPIQKKFMIFIPVIFTMFFLWFPSGLVLYYIVNNLVTIIQQQIIYRNLEKRGLMIIGHKIKK